MTTTLGIDCSHWQNDKSTPQKMDFQTAKESGAKFAFIKVSERGGIDQDFEYNWQAAKEAGIPRGGYHFLRWDLPATTQARVFCACLAGDPGELPPVADFEAPAKDNEWFTYEIIVNGKNVKTIVNGKTITDFTEPAEPAKGIPTVGEKGLFALQAHDPGSTVMFRNLQVKRLP